MDSVVSDDDDGSEDELGLDIHTVKKGRGGEKMGLLAKYTDTPDTFDAEMNETDIWSDVGNSKCSEFIVNCSRRSFSEQINISL